MTARIEALISRVTAQFGERVKVVPSICGEATVELAATELLSIATTLRDDEQFRFDQLIDLTGVDMLQYGQVEWSTEQSTRTGFSRGASRGAAVGKDDAHRFVVVYHLLSTTHNVRLRLRVSCERGRIGQGLPQIDSVVAVWASANWFEREAFDLFGIMFKGHPDLRRILTDYGFIGHPFRKDFPLIGNVEVRYDETQKRVVYQPVSIEPRILVPRVIRDDNRYDPALTAGKA
ncbi:MAG: NADH-quinone oxidoreductase subunit C [Solimonas sp.]